MDGNFTLYQERHSAFVSHHNGTTMTEIVWLVAGSGPVSVLLRNLAIPWIFPAKKFATGRWVDSGAKHLLDFLLLVLPSILLVTWFSDRIDMFVTTQLLLCFTLFVFCLYEFVSLYRDPIRPIDAVLDEQVENLRPVFITYLRSYCLVTTAIVILSIDFPAMPRRFAKTEAYGYSPMDVGVGVYAVVNGITAPETKRLPLRITKRVLQSMPILMLGFIRLAFVKLSGYHEHQSEYGVHWNFFFTLAAIKILSTLFSSCVSLRRTAGLLSLIIAISYEMCLKHGLDTFVLNGWDGADSRQSLLDANREGICSLCSYLALYLAGIQIGVLMQKPRARLKSWLILLLRCMFWCCISGVLVYWAHHTLGPASRRIANLTFVLWELFITSFLITGFLTIEVLTIFGCAIQFPLFSCGASPFEQLQPCLLNIINRRGIHFFVLCNILTGLVNLSMRTIDIQHKLIATAVVTAYMLVNTVVIRFV